MSFSEAHFKLHRRLSPSRWTAFVKPGRRLAVGDRIQFGERDDRACLLSSLDATVAEQPYLLGDSFTVADLNVAAVISRAVDMDLSDVPHLKAWLSRCLERPAARAALALKDKADRETPAEVTRNIARINRL